MRPAERMQKVLDYLGIGAVAMATQLGLTRTRIRDMIRNDAKSVAPDIAEALCSKFTTISIEWLLYENGEMLTKNTNPCSEEKINEHELVNKLMEVCQQQQRQIDQLMKIMEMQNKTISIFTGRPNVELGDPEELEENK